jgi:uncharacterized protein YuzE
MGSNSRDNVRPIYATLSNRGKTAYVGLTDRHDAHATASVPTRRVGNTSGIYVLDSLILDVDERGRLIGLEVLGDAKRVLPDDLVAAAKRT